MSSPYLWCRSVTVAVYLAKRMIEASDNAAATALFYFGGGCEALRNFNRLIPLRATEVGCESANYYGWGNTTTTAADQVALMRVFAYGAPQHVLHRDARIYGLHLMESVQPDQRWGDQLRSMGHFVRRPDSCPARSGCYGRAEERLEDPSDVLATDPRMPLAGQQHRLG